MMKEILEYHAVATLHGPVVPLLRKTSLCRIKLVDSFLERVTLLVLTNVNVLEESYQCLQESPILLRRDTAA